MLDCKHKDEFGAINRGLVVLSCKLHKKLVNDTICSQCPNREGKSDKVIEADFLRRSDEELARVKNVCKTCPHFTPHNQRCKKKFGEPIPIDVVAQNPAEHCPENRW